MPTKWKILALLVITVPVVQASLVKSTVIVSEGDPNPPPPLPLPGDED